MHLELLAHYIIKYSSQGTRNSKRPFNFQINFFEAISLKIWYKYVLIEKKNYTLISLFCRTIIVDNLPISKQTFFFIKKKAISIFFRIY